MLPQRDIEGIHHPRAEPHKEGQLTLRLCDLGVFASIPHPRKGGHQLGDLARLIPHPVAHTLLPQEGRRPGAELCAQAHNILRIRGPGNLAAGDLDVVQIGGTPLCARPPIAHAGQCGRKCDRGCRPGPDAGKRAAPLAAACGRTPSAAWPRGQAYYCEWCTAPKRMHLCPP